MDELVNQSSRKQNTSRKHLASGSPKDLWLIAQEGTVVEVDSALALLKKNCGSINGRNSFGLTPLHIATWRNHIPIVRRLLQAGADPNARDGESGWSSLHRALHFGHLAVGSVLLQSGASITLEDSKSRTPIDLLSGPVLQAVNDGDRSSVTTEVFSWGSGVNYQLGTGNAHIQKLPCKVDALHGSFIKFVSASKFHSVAVTSNGEVYTWGFGRGGRLGHPDFNIHSGQAAVITPRQVTSGLGVRHVKAVAAAKHHTVVATEGGEVFTWGSNREGQLGYTSVDTQPTPRRVGSLKARIVEVTAANKHTAAVSDSGEIFTWGCNREGQLGYGTSNSASNYTPRLVECLKGKIFIAVSAAKYHTIVLRTDGEIFTWGHRLVTPRRVVIARNIRKSGPTPLKFHRKESLHVVAIAAGVTHSIALTDDGALFFWVSSDPNSHCQQLHSLCGKNVVSISAGKYWTAAVTVTGDVYTWDGKKRKDETPITTRLLGVKKATTVSVGETHLLIISSLYHPVYPSFIANDDKQKIKQKVTKELDELDGGFVFDDLGFDDDDLLYPVQTEIAEENIAPSLKSLCEKVAMEYLVEPRNTMRLLEIADSLGADDLKKHCEVMVIRNLDYILTVSTHNFSSVPLDILVKLEKLLDTVSSESWSNRRLPTPTATLPAIVYSEEDFSDDELVRARGRCTKRSSSKGGGLGLDSFLTASNIIGKEEDISKQVRALKKKLQQIEFLEDKMFKGHALDDQQIKKVQTRSALERSLVELGVPVEKADTKASLSSASVDGKGNKRAVLRKQKRKSKNKGVEMEDEPNIFEVINQKDSVKSSEDQCPSFQDESKGSEEAVMKPFSEDSAPLIKQHLLNSSQCMSESTFVSKKKKNKKGGLSLFLSGALDDTPKYVAPPPPPPLVIKSEGGPVWGGAKTPKGSTSLREIQTEQFKRNEIKPSGTFKVPIEEVSDGSNGTKLSLGPFLSSSPIAVVSSRSPQARDAEKNTPSWAASGTPPSLSRLSLRDIQLQQEKKQQALLSHSPMTRTTGFNLSVGHVSASDSSSGGLNRWFKPEVEMPSSIRSIQIEEKAIKDLKRFYSSVKVVKNPL